MKNLTLARQKIVFDAQPLHRFEMPPQHRSRDELGYRRRVVAALLDFVQGPKANLLPLVFEFRSGLVPPRDPRIEIPAEIIEPLSARRELRHQARNSGQVVSFQVHERDHDIGDLHSGVVDVVLNIDALPRGPQQANEGIAQNGVAKMANVRRFVRIDARMLDQNMGAGLCRRGKSSPRAMLPSDIARFSLALMYPAPATSNDSKPSSGVSSAITSSAILRGAFFSRRARSNATGDANSPKARFGGCSRATFSGTTSYLRSRMARSRASSLFCCSKYTRESPVKIDGKPILAGRNEGDAPVKMRGLERFSYRCIPGKKR